MTGPAAEERLLVRIERGRPTPEEVAALTAALLAVAAARNGAEERPSPPGPGTARWYRWERTVAFRPGHSWRLAR
ncbi:acyl-CoA carboxylase epsilon subunit [Streptomyces sp. LUP47B]|uniref:acyl-CoA carboxylase epsilon subunit n=1 Tax=Streptomyces sp. LUP47B TaxID=1890286 RepID=UPI000851A29A